MISSCIVIVLFILASCIFLGIMHGENLWPLIATYWFLVAVKYVLEMMGQ